MHKLCYSAAGYTTLGLVAGLFYRSFTHAKDFHGQTQLSVMHTHLLALGMLFFLVLMALERLLGLTAQGTLFTAFFATYHAGLLITVAVMTWHGILQVNGVPESDVSPAVPGIAGMGHILLTIALVLLFVVLFRAIGPAKSAGAATPTGPAHPSEQSG